MKNADFRLQGGLTFAFLVPETVEEYNNLAADASACLDSAIDNVMYRGPFARLRERLAQRVEEQTSIARARKPHPSPEQAKVGVTVFDESPGGYISRAAAELGKDSAGDAFQSVFDEMLSANAALQDGDANKIVFDPSERVSRGPSATAGKGDVEAAKVILASGPKLQQALTQLANTLGHDVVLSGDEATQLRQLAVAYKEYRQAMSSVTRLVA